MYNYIYTQYYIYVLSLSPSMSTFPCIDLTLYTRYHDTSIYCAGLYAMQVPLLYAPVHAIWGFVYLCCITA